MKTLLEKLRAEWDSLAIGLAVFLFHLWHVPAIAVAEISRKGNLAFDFDNDRFLHMWVESPFPVRWNEDYYAARHSLAILPRLLCLPFVKAGFDAQDVACGVAAACAGLSSVLAFRIALALGLRRGLALVLTLFWTLSAVSLVLGVIPETYDLALVALSWQFLIAIRWTLGHAPSLATRITAAVANFGITITNVVLAGLTELVCRLIRQPMRNAILATAGFSAAVGAIAAVLTVASFTIWPVYNMNNAAQAVKQLYWSASSAEKTQERQSAAQVAWTFGAISFVAPPPARYPSGDPANPYLYDVRGHGYGAAGWIAVLGWLGLLAVGAVAAARERQFRPVWIIAALWIAGNLALHSYWQFRDTLFLYSPHSHIAFFILAIAGARWAQMRSAGGALAYGAAAAAVTLCAALNNLPIYQGLISLN